jgi:hypothetical protein
MDISGKQRSGSRRKSGVRAQKSKAHVGINEVSLGQALFLKNAKSLLGKAKQCQASLDGYL